MATTMADDPRDMLADAARDLMRRNRETVTACLGLGSLIILFFGAGMALGWGWFLIGIGGLGFFLATQRSG